MAVLNKEWDARWNNDKNRDAVFVKVEINNQMVKSSANLLSPRAEYKRLDEGNKP